MTIKQFKKELKEVREYLIKKQTSRERYPLIHKIADKCPKLASILKEQEEYFQNHIAYDLPEDKRASALIMDPKFGEFEIKILNAILECQELEETKM